MFMLKRQRTKPANTQYLFWKLEKKHNKVFADEVESDKFGQYPGIYQKSLCIVSSDTQGCIHTCNLLGGAKMIWRGGVAIFFCNNLKGWVGGSTKSNFEARDLERGTIKKHQLTLIWHKIDKRLAVVIWVHLPYCLTSFKGLCLQTVTQTAKLIKHDQNALSCSACLEFTWLH